MLAKLGVLGVAIFAVVQVAVAQTCPNPPVPGITSSQVPADVCVPSGFPGNPIQFFDDYSWKAFLSLVWPAAPGQRGQPDNSKSVGDSGPRVFETYKSVWEIFHNDGSAPAAWNVFDAAQFNACNASVSSGDMILASFSKFSDLGQAGFGSLVGPLVAQNTTYVRYLTGFNETEFTQIRNGQLYLRSNIPIPPGSMAFSNGSLDVKSAWILMKDIPHPERYYTRTALVLDPQTGNCSTAMVGLVGLHIVQKTPTRPQWIWTSFEQVDNVPPADAGGSGKFNFNDGTNGTMPTSNPYPIDPLMLPTPPPFNVQRIMPINPSTVNTNSTYRSLLKGSVWRFYQLVMTQWPLAASQPALPGTPANTFPGTNATSAFANVTLETFDQANTRTGCMNCHNSTRLPTDFVWTLNDHAFPANVPNFLLRNAAVRQMQRLMQLSTPQGKALAMKEANTKAAAATVPQLNSFSDVQQFIDQVLTQNAEQGGVSVSPHKAFWRTLTYDQFVNGNIPGVRDPNTGQPMPILIKGNSAQSNLILSLQGAGPIFGPDGPYGQMPANGPPFFTPEQISAVAAWIDKGCPR